MSRLPTSPLAWPRAWLLLGLLLQAGAGAAGLPADPLPGRLFHSAAERAALDRNEALAQLPVLTSVRREAVAPPQPPERSSRLSGFVLRSDGHDSYWLDSPPQPSARLRR